MKILLIAIISLTLMACSSGQKRPDEMDVVYQWRTYDCGEKPERDKVALTPPVWEVTDEGLWTLTGDQYSILGELIADLIKAMEQMKEVIYFYERCIVTAKALTNE